MSLLETPQDLPVPTDDGQCAHLKVGMPFPIDTLLNLPTTNQHALDITSQPRTVLYFYPRTGVPDQKLPDGWNEIAGARGCTPEACGFRDHFQELQSLGANVYGCSTQTCDYQQEAARRLHVPFDLLSDSKLELLHALKLPYFQLPELDNVPLIKRLTIIIRDSKIEHVFYPVFPPDKHAHQVIQWLKAHPIA